MKPDTHLNIIFNRLIDNILDNENNTTIFIGAGCSLTSSNNDITTYGIIKDIVKNHSQPNEKIADNWEDLYSKFVNEIWEGQGEQNKINILKGYFDNMKPSVGYENLRWLVENNYINSIITTNFDLMINKVLEGITYNLYVGTKQVQKFDKAKLTVIKAHGDLEHGELRFSPKELNHLPEELKEKIKEHSKGTLIVTGFRGQDIGVIDSLDASGQYNAYWTSPEELNRLNNYENHQIFLLMDKRASDVNYLFGEQFGRFDSLMINIKNKIIEKISNIKLQKDKQLGELWNNCEWIYNKLQLSKRVLGLFQILLCLMYRYLKSYNWEITKPFFSSDYKTLLKSTINLLSKNIFTDNDRKCVKNEVEALIFAFSCSLNIARFDYSDLTNIVLNIKKDFEASNFEIDINEKFWNDTVVLASINLKDIKDYKSTYSYNDSIEFSFDKGKDLQIISKQVNIYNIKHLVDKISILLLFCETSISSNVNRIKATLLHAYNCKLFLEKSLYSFDLHENKIKISLNQMQNQIYIDIYTQLLYPYFKEYEVEDNRLLLCNDIIVSVTITKDIAKEKLIFSWEGLSETASAYKSQYLSGFSEEKIIKRDLSVFNEFLSSLSNGLFIVGKSGSGKTTLLKFWISALNDKNYLIYPIKGNEINIQNINGSNKLILFATQNELSNINSILAKKNKILILIIDSLNEIPLSYEIIISLYEKIIGFCNNLAKNNYSNIKLVVSSRTDYFNQLTNNTSKIPPENSFYSIYFDERGDKTQTIFEVPLLTEKEVDLFIKSFGYDEIITYKLLFKEFGNLISLPFNLKLICESINIHDSKSLNSKNFFETWFAKIIIMAAQDGIPDNAVVKIIDRIIEYKYFDDSNDNIQTYRLSVDFNKLYPSVLNIYNWLVAQKVFSKNDNHPSYIQFSHDRVEEFFLYRYLNKTYKNSLNNILTKLKVNITSNPILKQSLKDIILSNFKIKRFNFTKDFVEFINNDKNIVLQIFLEALFQLSDDYCKDVHDLLVTLKFYIDKSKFYRLLNSMLYSISEKIDNTINIGINIINIIYQITTSSNDNEIVFLNNYSKFMKAKYLYMFADESNPQVFKDALEICESIENSLVEDKTGDFADSLLFLKSLLLQNQGDLNDAIKLMDKCYNNQVIKGAYDLAAKSAANLGAMYRDMTMFDKAIELYDKIKLDYISNPELKYRLLLNKGIIYKNRIQNAMFDGIKDSKENLDNYEASFQCLQNTFNFAEKTDNIRLLFEVCTEFVELSCVACYLKIGTINDSIYWGKKIDEFLPRFNVPVARIERLRMWARIDALSKNFEKSIEKLEEGYSIAMRYNIPFRASDCCNIITGVICEMIDNHIPVSVEILNKGIFYGNYSISYYKKLNKPNHRYLQDSIFKVKKISAYKNDNK